MKITIMDPETVSKGKLVFFELTIRTDPNSGFLVVKTGVVVVSVKIGVVVGETHSKSGQGQPFGHPGRHGHFSSS